MAKRFNPGVVAKRGKLRVLHKRPASKKSVEYKKVKYVRGPRQIPAAGIRRDRATWKRTLQPLLTASNCQIQQLLERDDLLPKWGGKLCPRCFAAGKANSALVSSEAFASTSVAARHVAPTTFLIISIHSFRCRKESNINHCRSSQHCSFSY